MAPACRLKERDEHATARGAMTVEKMIGDAYDRLFGGERNMGMGERVASTGLGLAMAAGGLRRGADLPGALMGIVGAAMVARGMSGHCPVKASFADGSHRLEHRSADVEPIDRREPSYS
jgi:uncharacterized membrane protein